MKKIKRIIIAIAVFVTSVTLLASCTANPKFDIELIASRTRIAVVMTVVDEDEVITTGSLRGRAYLVDEDEDEDDYTLVDTINFDEAEEDEQRLEFTDLKTNTEYRVIIEGTEDGTVTEYYEKYIFTTDVGATEEDPILISTVDEFLAMSNDYDAYYELQNDLDLNNEEVSPLFSSSYKFLGQLDGNGYTISNFAQTESSTISTYNGLFGYIGSEGRIFDLNIKNATMTYTKTGESYNGILAGVNFGTIENVSITGDLVIEITGGQTTGITYVGGFVAFNGNVIKDCSVGSAASMVSINVSAGKSLTIGGFVGGNGVPSGVYDNLAVIEGCSAYADIEGKNYNSSSADSVNIEQYIGGFVGQSCILIKDCIVEANIVTTSIKNSEKPSTYLAYVGGFAGKVFVLGLDNVVANVSITYTSEDMTELSDTTGAYIGLLVGRIFDADVNNAIVVTDGEQSITSTNDDSVSFDIVASVSDSTATCYLINNPTFVDETITFDVTVTEYSTIENVSDFIDEYIKSLS